MIYYLEDTEKNVFKVMNFQYINKHLIGKTDKFCSKKYLVVAINISGFNTSDIFYVGDRFEVMKEVLKAYENEDINHISHIEFISEHSSLVAAIKNAKKKRKSGGKISVFKKVVKEVVYEEKFVEIY